MSFASAVLILAYNRADRFSGLLEAVEDSGDRKIYVSIDGPKTKSDVSAQHEMQLRIDRSTRRKNIIVRKNPDNQGCKRAIESALDWVLGLSAEVIVLEDDLLPNRDFFLFCDATLGIYRDNWSLQQISGSNPAPTWVLALFRGKSVFGPVPNISGWATWDSRWHRYRDNQETGERNRSTDVSEEMFKSKLKRRWSEIQLGAMRAQTGELDSWGYPWAYWGIRNGLGTLFPPVNLVEHHGFDDRATHTKAGRFVRARPLPGRSSFGRVTTNRLNFTFERLSYGWEMFWWIRTHFWTILVKKMRVLAVRPQASKPKKYPLG